MPSPGASAAPRLPMEDSYLELLADTLESMEIPARSQFLQRFFRTTTQLDLRESQCLQLWEDMLTRRVELSRQLGRTLSLKTVLMDVLSTSGLVRVPVLLEYDEFKRLQTNAVTDPLTGLYNRRLFEESFEKELNRARRYGLPLGIVILDLHRFKEVNDKYGHPRGDDVLKAAASTFQKALRTSDSAFRIGGDEFALLLPQTDPDQALALSRRVEAVFAEMVRPLQLAISVSMDHGVANYPQDGDQSERLIHVADERLYRWKHANQNRTVAVPAGQAVSSSQPEPPQASQPVPVPASIAYGRTLDSTSGAASSSSASTHPFASSISASPDSISYSVQRKAERVSMVGTNAYAVIGDQGSRRARVIDLGFGGVALEFEQPEELPESILAILHVPILPPVRVFLKPVWTRRTSEGAFRLGCHFVS
jgi:diguanylate cyclase (GGDEF)-like protein